VHVVEQQRLRAGAELGQHVDLVSDPAGAGDRGCEVVPAGDNTVSAIARLLGVSRSTLAG